MAVDVIIGIPTVPSCFSYSIREASQLSQDVAPNCRFQLRQPTGGRGPAYAAALALNTTEPQRGHWHRAPTLDIQLTGITQRALGVSDTRDTDFEAGLEAAEEEEEERVWMHTNKPGLLSRKGAADVGVLHVYRV